MGRKCMSLTIAILFAINLYLCVLTFKTGPKAQILNHVVANDQKLNLAISIKPDSQKVVVEHKKEELDENTFMDLMEARTSLISKVCKVKARLGSPYPNLKDIQHIYALEEKKFEWCPVFKAASSLWFCHLVTLSGVQAPKEMANSWPVQKASFAVKKANLKSNSTYTNIVRRIFMQKNGTSLMVVRHPFERLVSAFRDKLERTHDVAFYQEKYGKKIVKVFRKKAIQTLGSSYFEAGNNFGAPLPVEPARRRTPNLPTFWEFVQSLKKGHASFFDEHWIPASIYCMLCKQSIHYNYVIKYEHLEEETNSLFNHMGWNELQFENSVINQNRKGDLTSKEVTDIYFKDLGDSDILSLYNIYKEDFLLFNYTFVRGSLKLPLKEDIMIKSADTKK